MIQTIDLDLISCAATNKFEGPPCGLGQRRFREQCKISSTGRRRWSYPSTAKLFVFQNGPWEFNYYITRYITPVTVAIAAKSASNSSGVDDLQTKYLSFTFSVGSRSAHSNTAYGIHVADAYWGSIISWELLELLPVRRSWGLWRLNRTVSPQLVSLSC